MEEGKFVRQFGMKATRVFSTHEHAGNQNIPVGRDANLGGFSRSQGLLILTYLANKGSILEDEDTPPMS